jgi:hypothetical protein
MFGGTYNSGTLDIKYTREIIVNEMTDCLNGIP